MKFKIPHTTFAVVNDVHLKLKARNRKDGNDFLNVQLAALEFVLANSKAKHLLCTGDVFNKHLVYVRAVRALDRLLKTYDAQLITTVGNHDVPSYLVEDYQDNSPLSILEGYGSTKVLHNGKHVKISCEGNSINIYGFGVKETVTDEFLDGLYPMDAYDSAFKIALVHAYIGGSESKAGSMSITNFNPDGVHAMFVGDVHNDPWFDHKHDSGVYSYNCGALERYSIDEADRDCYYLLVKVAYIPRVADIVENPKKLRSHLTKLIDAEFKIKRYDDGAWVWAVEEVKIPVPKGSDVFYLEEKAKKESNEVKAFKARLASAMTRKKIDPVAKITKVGKSRGYSSDVIKTAIEAYAEVMKNAS